MSRPCDPPPVAFIVGGMCNEESDPPPPTQANMTLAVVSTVGLCTTLLLVVSTSTEAISFDRSSLIGCRGHANLSSAFGTPVTSSSLLPYDSNDFNGLNPVSFYTANNGDRERRPAVEVLLDVVDLHGLTGQVGVSLLHNHFPLGGHECLVMAQSPGETVARLDHYDNYSADDRDVLFHSPSFRARVGAGCEAAVPYMFMVDGERSGFSPVQFWDPSCESAATMRSMAHKLFTQFTDFLDDFASAVQALGNAHHLGLYVVYGSADTLPDVWAMNERTFVSSTKGFWQLTAPELINEDDSGMTIITHSFRPAPTDGVRQHRCEMFRCDGFNHDHQQHCDSGCREKRNGGHYEWHG
eukprot:m.51373 g.51373  ORF g.51373 m.51373 type:complete len:354 (+) comp16426_c0_seq3:1072-2133(+)